MVGNSVIRKRASGPINAICDHKTENRPPRITILIQLSQFFCTFSPFKVQFFEPDANASSNVKPDVSQSKAMFHNDVGSRIYCHKVLTLSNQTSRYIRKIRIHLFVFIYSYSFIRTRIHSFIRLVFIHGEDRN